MAEQSLRNKTTFGVGWSAAETFLARGVSFIVGLVLARILSPEEYGLIGIVLIFTTILEGFVDSGFASSLIRKKEVSDNDYNTMFITNMVMSILMFILLFFCAPLISRFFERPLLVALVRVMGIILIFQAFSIVQNTVLSRRIDFKTKTKASVISAILSGVIGITMALMEFGVWSLVGQQLSRQFFYSLFLWTFNKWRPSLQFSVDSFYYMWGFGWKLLLSGLLDRTWNQLYQVVVGKYYSSATLGQYSRSKEFASIYSSNLTSIVQRVSFPVLAQVQSDKERMLSAYKKIIKTTMFVSATCMISLAAVSEPFIYCLIGTNWIEAASFLPLICISMSLWPLHAINLNMLQVQGRSDIFLYVEIVKKVIAIGPIFLGIFVSIYWMLIGSIITGLISFFLNSFWTGKKMGYSSWMQLKDVAPSYGISFFIGTTVYFLKYLPLTHWLIFPLQVLVVIIVFFVVNEIIHLDEYIEVKKIIKQYLSGTFKK